jgi:lysozyme
VSIYPTQLSLRGAAFIGSFEGFRANWYPDPVGVLTIGFGHTGPLPRGFAEPLSRSEAERLLQYDALRFSQAVAAIRPRILRQSRFDALVSFAFNLGENIFSSDQPRADGRPPIGWAVRRRFGRSGAVADALLLYDRAGTPLRPMAGLTRRRCAEVKLWNTGRYA